MFVYVGFHMPTGDGNWFTHELQTGLLLILFDSP